MKNWVVFFIAIGCLLVTVSPQLPSSGLYMVAGLVLIVGGAIKLFKNKK